VNFKNLQEKLSAILSKLLPFDNSKLVCSQSVSFIVQ
jgi:hypothetical protein